MKPKLCAETLPQGSAALDEQIAVALGGANYDWNRWAGHPQPPTPHPQKSKQKKNKPGQQQDVKQAATSSDDYTVCAPGVSSGKAGIKEEELSAVPSMTGGHSVDSVTAGSGEANLGLGSARQQNLYACSLLVAQAVYTSSRPHRQLCVPNMP